MSGPLRYERIVDVLSERVPSFGDFPDAYTDRDLPQVVFGRFGTFLVKRIAQGSGMDIKLGFDLLNEMAEAEDLRVRILAQTGTLEVLIESPQAVDVARSFLFAKALDDLADLIRYWGTGISNP